MIISASRKCDIPNYASDWFIESIKKGTITFPMNLFMERSINVTPDNTDCIVFWTKNPEPMMSRINELSDYTYYFQFTLTGYSKRIEPGVPDKHHMIEVFKTLSSMIGKEKVIWRYDPIFIFDVYNVEYHKRAFSQIAAALDGYATRCVFSFIDLYGKVAGNMARIHGRAPDADEAEKLVCFMAAHAKTHNMEIETCAEQGEFSKYGVNKGHCIDAKLIYSLTGKRIDESKDNGQRTLCGCCKSVDVGTYHTCKNGCIYCYAK